MHCKELGEYVLLVIAFQPLPLAIECVGKEYGSSASVILLAGDRACRAIERLQSVGLQLNPGLMRSVFERMLVAEDVDKVLSAMENSTTKMTATAMRDLASKVMNDRWWKWCLLHEDLGPEYIHPDRSMSVTMSICLLCTGFVINPLLVVCFYCFYGGVLLFFRADARCSLFLSQKRWEPSTR